MKYIRYTLVDKKTNKPVSQEPAKNGPKHPDGVTPTFDIQSTFSTGVPTIYGIAEDTFEPADWMFELSEESFYTTMRQEFKTRASDRRKTVERGGYWVTPETFVRTDEGSQNRLAQLVTTINNDPDLVSVDFEVTPGQWTTFDTATALTVAKTVSSHVQRCFSWCRGVHEALDAASTLEEMQPIVNDISNFVADDNPPVQATQDA